MKRQKYTLGFMFDHDLTKVALIKKTKPEPHFGLLNGIGGKVEDGESFMDCMIREFEEETGFKETDWKPAIEIQNPRYKFRVFASINNLSLLKTVTEEEIIITDVRAIAFGKKYVAGVDWLVPYCKALLIHGNLDSNSNEFLFVDNV